MYGTGTVYTKYEGELLTGGVNDRDNIDSDS